ncbi:MAG: alpha/beta hydrolase [Campylobacterales bacterium]|nr:alpha/beta hydrolase [Campylobacterales bacterium]
MYRPEGKTDSSIVLYVPGGAWHFGDKDTYDELAHTLVSRYGLTVVIANYRLSGLGSFDSIKHPMHVQDIAAAFDWVKEHLGAYANTQRVFLFGQSAGGHLVALLGTNEQYLAAHGRSLGEIRGVIAMSGTYNLYDMTVYPNNPYGMPKEDIDTLADFIEDAFGSTNKAALDAASPAMLLEGTKPPFMVLYAQDDISGFAGDAMAFAKAIEESNNSVELHFVSKADISTDAWDSAQDMATKQVVFADFPGHYAEVFTINTSDYDHPTTRALINFIQKH